MSNNKIEIKKENKDSNPTENNKQSWFSQMFSKKTKSEPNSSPENTVENELLEISLNASGFSSNPRSPQIDAATSNVTTNISPEVPSAISEAPPAISKDKSDTNSGIAAQPIAEPIKPQNDPKPQTSIRNKHATLFGQDADTSEAERLKKIFGSDYSDASFEPVETKKASASASSQNPEKKNTIVTPTALENIHKKFKTRFDQEDPERIHPLQPKTTSSSSSSSLPESDTSTYKPSSYVTELLSKNTTEKEFNKQLEDAKGELDGLLARIFLSNKNRTFLKGTLDNIGDLAEKQRAGEDIREPAKKLILGLLATIGISLTSQQDKAEAKGPSPAAPDVTPKNGTENSMETSTESNTQSTTISRSTPAEEPRSIAQPAVPVPPKNSAQEPTVPEKTKNPVESLIDNLRNLKAERQVFSQQFPHTTKNGVDPLSQTLDSIIDNAKQIDPTDRSREAQQRLYFCNAQFETLKELHEKHEKHENQQRIKYASKKQATKKDEEAEETADNFIHTESLSTLETNSPTESDSSPLSSDLELEDILEDTPTVTPVITSSLPDTKHTEGKSDGSPFTAQNGFHKSTLQGIKNKIENTDGDGLKKKYLDLLTKDNQHQIMGHLTELEAIQQEASKLQTEISSSQGKIDFSKRVEILENRLDSKTKELEKLIPKPSTSINQQGNPTPPKIETKSSSSTAAPKQDVDRAVGFARDRIIQCNNLIDLRTRFLKNDRNDALKREKKPTLTAEEIANDPLIKETKELALLYEELRKDLTEPPSVNTEILERTNRKLNGLEGGVKRLQDQDKADVQKFRKLEADLRAERLGQSKTASAPSSTHSSTSKPETKTEILEDDEDFTPKPETKTEILEDDEDLASPKSKPKHASVDELIRRLEIVNERMATEKNKFQGVLYSEMVSRHQDRNKIADAQAKIQKIEKSEYERQRFLMDRLNNLKSSAATMTEEDIATEIEDIEERIDYFEDQLNNNFKSSKPYSSSTSTSSDTAPSGIDPNVEELQDEIQKLKEELEAQKQEAKAQAQRIETQNQKRISDLEAQIKADKDESQKEIKKLQRQRKDHDKELADAAKPKGSQGWLRGANNFALPTKHARAENSERAWAPTAIAGSLSLVINGSLKGTELFEHAEGYGELLGTMAGILVLIWFIGLFMEMGKSFEKWKYKPKDNELDTFKSNDTNEPPEKEDPESSYAYI